jgi:SagB-type dehydrogenase family enzyme
MRTGMPLLEKVQAIKLAQPLLDGDVSLDYCIRQRRSVRGFRDRALTRGELGQLLWAAQGVTGPEAERAVSSAGALYPLELHVVAGDVTSVPAGVYHYLARRHELLLTAPSDLRGKMVVAARDQDWIATAPAIICIAAVFERTTVKYGQRGRGYVYIEAGHAAENLMLQAVALGLATTVVGAFSDAGVTRFLHLGADETPLCLIPVGEP